jgi:hypothetical protein
MKTICKAMRGTSGFTALPPMAGKGPLFYTCAALMIR